MSEMVARCEVGDDPAAEPSWLGEGADAAMALLHRPRRASRGDTAVLIVPPFGWAEVCSYRDRRIWAHALADAGFATARLTLPGSGDGGGNPCDPDLPARWQAAIAAAAQWLREATGAARVAVFAIGLGGLLACAAAEAGAPIDDFMLWGVMARGTALLRQELAYAGVIMSISDQSELERTLPDGSLQLTGYRLDAATVEAVRTMELDPRRIASAPAARVLLLDRDGLPVDPRLERGFREAGADVELLTTTDWVEFISPAGEKRSEPPVSIEATIAWLARSPPSGNGRASGGSRAAARDPGCHGTRVADQVLVAPGVRERILRLDGQLTGCFATATEPVDGVERVPVTALMLHAYHTGPGRMWVELARRWAARGVTVVRADLPGLHESPGRSPRQLRDRWLYRDEFIAHSMALVDALPRIGLSSRIMLGGFCAGAYWAMHAAIGDPRVTDLLLVNQFVVRWHDELVAERLAAASAGNLRRRAWRRLRTRELSVETLREGVGKVVHERRAVSRPAERAHSAELMRALAQLDDQRTETVMVFTEREPLLDQIRRAGVHKRLAELPHLTLEELPVIDHNLWAFTVQASVHEALDRALERALARIPGDAPPPSAAVESTI